MHVPPSEAARFPLPGWAYVPGVSLQADHARLAPVKALVPTRFVGFVPAQHPALRYGLALNDAGFFWECHEILEAVWAAAPQGGRERILLRACIQVANGNLKLKMQRAHAAARLYAEALAGLDELRVRRAVRMGSSFADAFPAAALAESLRQTRDRSMATAARPILFGKMAST
ncbi:MAG: hypothetical protein BGP05_08500 [Rhizobiales bacterium 62-47]|nr:DUF309 domain-containing protein [Hyphomicrobiales bacterium]OJY13955.1 MAG: hypothetical protein BGP05_08500 [Rhizobiales bacterium 62-47]